MSDDAEIVLGLREALVGDRADLWRNNAHFRASVQTLAGMMDVLRDNAVQSAERFAALEKLMVEDPGLAPLHPGWAGPQFRAIGSNDTDHDERGNPL